MRGARPNLPDRVAVITGGARGIGLAIAEHLTSAGTRVAVADIDEQAADWAAKQLSDALPFRVDVADRASVSELHAEVEDRLGSPDFLINNAAVMALAPFLDADELVVRQTIETNFLGVVNCMQAFLPAMKARGSGHVVNVSSAAGKWGVPGENIYCATKHAVGGLSELVRRELIGTGVEISVAYFGPAKTQLAAGMQPTRGIRLLDPDRVARVIVAALAQPRAEIWIPRWLGWLEASGHLLPRWLRERAQDAFGLNTVATNVDFEERRRYEAAAFPGRRSV